ncbi:hypothetical protein C7441_10824 [Pseudaminobacter salicylatoxidans]|uniref:Uncharacterized protein n=1 Tax=Pseudaminobacter salicylatoxidans TaxID=93369 RepID=A0A316C311_PSESE|nr:hypothetical protein C7441_10824 [Pseudaminobacter salicylatoxidans]
MARNAEILPRQARSGELRTPSRDADGFQGMPGRTKRGRRGADPAAGPRFRSADHGAAAVVRIAAFGIARFKQFGLRQLRFSFGE